MNNMLATIRGIDANNICMHYCFLILQSVMLLVADIGYSCKLHVDRVFVGTYGEGSCKAFHMIFGSMPDTSKGLQ